VTNQESVDNTLLNFSFELLVFPDVVNNLFQHFSCVDRSTVLRINLDVRITDVERGKFCLDIRKNKIDWKNVNIHIKVKVTFVFFNEFIPTILLLSVVTQIFGFLNSSKFITNCFSFILRFLLFFFFVSHFILSYSKSPNSFSMRSDCLCFGVCFFHQFNDPCGEGSVRFLLTSPDFQKGTW